MQDIIEKAWDNREMLKNPDVIKTIESIIEALDKGKIRVAEPTEDGNWIVNSWVKSSDLVFPNSQNGNHRNGSHGVL